MRNLMSDTQPIYKSVFGDQWETLPQVLKKRYSNRPYSNDMLIVKGKLNIYFSKILIFVLPILRSFKVLAPYQGKDIPVIVKLRGKSDLSGLYFDRMFYYPE